MERMNVNPTRMMLTQLKRIDDKYLDMYYDNK